MGASLCCLVGVYVMVDHNVCTQWSNLVEIAICRRNISNKWLFIIDCAIYWIKYCITSLLHSACNRKEYQGYLLWSKGGRCLELTILTPSCANCLEILGASSFWIPKGLSGTVIGLLYLFTDSHQIPLSLQTKPIPPPTSPVGKHKIVNIYRHLEEENNLTL